MSTNAATKANVTKAQTKAPAVKRAVLSDAARLSLGIETKDVSVHGMSVAFTTAQATRAVVAFDAYALSQGWGSDGKAHTGADIAKALGTTPGNVSALLRAGAILNRAGSHAASIGPDAVTLCQNTNAQQTSALDALTGTRLVSAVRKMRRAALDTKAEAQGRKARPNGTDTKAEAKAPKVDTSTNAGRMTVVLQTLNAVTRDANDDARDAILAACDKAEALLAHIRAAYSEPIAVTEAKVNPTKATPATVAKASTKAKASA